RVKLAQHVTDRSRRLLEFGRCTQSQLRHGVENSTMNRLEPVADKRQRPIHDDIHGIIQIRLFAEYMDGNGFDQMVVLLHKCFPYQFAQRPLWPALWMTWD